MNAINQLYKANTKKLKRSLLRKSPSEADTDDAQRSTKVLGPYSNKDKWRIVVISDGKRKAMVFDTVEQANLAKTNLSASLDKSSKITVGDLIELFLEFKRQRGCVDRSILHTRHALLRIFPDLERAARMSAESAEALYMAIVDKYAVASHAISLRNARAMYRHAIKRKLVSDNPFADVLSIGKAKKGKPQLRTDEAKRLTAYLTTQASAGNWHALALLTQLFLGLRSSEALRLKKRDLDCDASIIAIDGTKTKNAKRRLALDAPMVRELLRRRSEGMRAESYLFSHDGISVLTPTSLHKALKRACERADVPIVCPHSLRGLHSSLAVQAGASSSFVAHALGHGSDDITKRHYISESAADSARSARVTEALGSGKDAIAAAFLALTQEERDQVCLALGYRRVLPSA